VSAGKRWIKGIKRAGKRAKLAFGLARPYQVKREGGADARWELIAPHLAEADRSVLDVGSNLGAMTVRAAAGGRFAIGVEPAARLVQTARRQARGAGAVGFVNMKIDRQSVLTLPEFDVVLCLSVHHYWVRDFGEAQAWQIVGELLRRARHRFFFEPASVKRKFGSPDLDFADLDREAIVEYNTKHLEAVAAPDQTIRVLGETPCRPREPFRMMFLVERPAAQARR
jgi:SAM-dependent methyltransferase